MMMMMMMIYSIAEIVYKHRSCNLRPNVFMLYSRDNQCQSNSQVGVSVLVDVIIAQHFANKTDFLKKFKSLRRCNSCATQRSGGGVYGSVRTSIAKAYSTIRLFCT